jgi:hypothetical protein
VKKVASSPERHSFQLEAAKKRAEEDGRTEIPVIYEQLFKTAKEQDAANLVNPKWQQDNLEYDLRSTEWICNKVKASDAYAQNLYAAMCNMEFQKLAVMPILKNQRWACSWRHAGGIVADMLEKGDYIDWYCSGIRNDGYQDDLDPITSGQYVPEGVVTEEIEQDLKRLGWIPVEYDDE